MKNTPVDTTKPKATNIFDAGYNHINHIWWALNVLQHDKRLLTQEEWDDIMTYMKWIEDELEESMWSGVSLEDREYDREEKTKKK